MTESTSSLGALTDCQIFVIGTQQVALPRILLNQPLEAWYRLFSAQVWQSALLTDHERVYLMKFLPERPHQRRVTYANHTAMQQDMVQWPPHVWHPGTTHQYWIHEVLPRLWNHEQAFWGSPVSQFRAQLLKGFYDAQTAAQREAHRIMMRQRHLEALSLYQWNFMRQALILRQEKLQAVMMQAARDESPTEDTEQLLNTVRNMMEVDRRRLVARLKALAKRRATLVKPT